MRKETPWRIKICMSLKQKRIINWKLSSEFLRKLLKNFGKFLVCHPKNWGSSCPKRSTWKTQICCQQISTIRPYWLSDQLESVSSLSKKHEPFEQEPWCINRYVRYVFIMDSTRDFKFLGRTVNNLALIFFRGSSSYHAKRKTTPI